MRHSERNQSPDEVLLDFETSVCREVPTIRRSVLPGELSLQKSCWNVVYKRDHTTALSTTGIENSRRCREYLPEMTITLNTHEVPVLISRIYLPTPIYDRHKFHPQIPTILFRLQNRNDLKIFRSLLLTLGPLSFFKTDSNKNRSIYLPICLSIYLSL